MKKSICFSVIFASIVCSLVMAGGPPTAGEIDVEGEGFSECDTQFIDVASVVFLQLNYDGIAPLTINTRLTTDPIDTELGLYDSSGALIATNDDIDFAGGNLLSEITAGGLPAGEYFVAIGLFNTVFNAGFDATSTASDSGDVIIKVTTGVLPATDGIINVDLNYNFNGMVHADEAADTVNDPDHPNGYRSISDRGLDFRNGMPSHPTLDRYFIVPDGATYDIVHLGNRNTVDGGNWAFDTEVDFDAVGIQPDWLPEVDQSGRQTTTFAEPIPLNSNSEVQLIFQISNGGGSFDVVVGLSDGSEFVGLASGPDWFGPFNGQPNIGIFDGAHGVDFAFMDPKGTNTLLITEVVIGLGEFAGLEATSLAFENATNTNGGVAIIAANFAGTAEDCLIGDLNGDGAVDLLDVQPFVAALKTGEFSCEADINQDGAVNLLDVQAMIDLLQGG